MEGFHKGLRAVAMAAVLGGLAGCDFTFQDVHLHTRGLSPDDVDQNAPPNKSEVRGRITTDVRENNDWRSRLDEGNTLMPVELKFDEHKINVVRTKDGKTLWKINLWNDSPERQAPITETAFYDEDDRVYFYHYEGGHPYRDVWFGPIRVSYWRKTIPKESE